VGVHEILTYGFKGSKESKAPHIKRVEYAIREIGVRFGIRHPEQLQCKHVEWFLRRYMADREPSTQYTYWLSIRRYLDGVKKEEDWAPRLRGPWEFPDGIVDPNRHPGGRPRIRASSSKIAATNKRRRAQGKTKTIRKTRRRRSRDEK
jgi:hypothetical protein